MPQFEYLVKDGEGHDRKGVEEAPNPDALVQSLRRQGYLIIRINRMKEPMRLFSIEIGRTKQEGKSGRIKIDDLVIFSRQLATLIGAGVPLVQSLEVLVEQTEKAKLRIVIQDLQKEVQGGKSLSEALERQSKIFSYLFIHMVRAGESSGHLEEILDRLSGYLEKTSTLRRKVGSALSYPAFVCSMAVIIVGGILTFIIPKFAEIYTSINAQLPMPTLILMSLSDFLKNNLLYIAGALVLLFVLFNRWKNTKGGAYSWDAFKLRLKLFGPLFTKVAVSKFCRTFSMLIKSGVPMLTSLEIVARTSGNCVLEREILNLKEAVTKGEGLSASLQQSKVLPPMVTRMIAVGEETGELENMLTKAADFYDTQVDSAVSTLTSLIEPLMIVFLAVVIGAIVVAMFLPVFNLTQAIH